MPCHAIHLEWDQSGGYTIHVRGTSVGLTDKVSQPKRCGDFDNLIINRISWDKEVSACWYELPCSLDIAYRQYLKKRAG